jgi:hypothetical protein
MRSYLKEQIAAPAVNIEINDRGGSAALTTRYPSINNNKNNNE